jgi:starch-binding outer membrane protein, SusD/RagB family
MKKNLRLLTFSVLLFTACSKKDKPTPPPPAPTGTGVGTAVGKQLSATDSLSSFNGYYKTGTLSDQDVATGITIFAPANSAFGNGQALVNGQLPDSSQLKDYIVKGLLKAADLTDNKTLTTLSGKTLTVTVKGNEVRVNGVLINLTSAYTGDGFIIYGASRLLNAAAVFSYTVWDATQWSASKPKGDLATGAGVALYSSQADYASGAKALYSVTTGNDGVAAFNGVRPGTYYVVASKGAVNNVFNVYNETLNDAYLGYATDNDIDNSGNIKWKDVNGDGIVDTHDMVAVPALTVQAKKDSSSNGIILIGYVTKPLQTATDAQNILNNTYSGLLLAYSSMVVLDGMLSDDATCATQPTYCPYDNFTFTATDANISTLWSGTYNLIGNLNRVIKDVPGMDIAADQKTDLVAQAKGLRGYIYLIMGQYFGDLPIHNNITSTLFPGISRSSISDVYNAIITDLTAAAADLPVTRATGPIQLTKPAAYGLLAKAALWKKDYTAVAGYTGQALSGYNLSAVNTWFTSATNAENVWCPTFSNIGPLLPWYYTGVFPSTTVKVCPVLRYGQILLIDAEAQIALGHYSVAQQDLNVLLTRRFLSTVSITNSSDGMTALQTAWQTETYRQGDRFVNLLRWGTASQVLSANGFMPAKNSLLPVPQSLLGVYPNLVQNPGY